MNNPYAGKGATLEHAFDFGYRGYPMNMAWRDAAMRAYREGQALRATYAMSGNTTLRHPKVTMGVVR